MFKETAAILRKELEGVEGKLILNVGSGTPDYYIHQQPWIWEDVLQPLRMRGNMVMNLDMKEATMLSVMTHIQVTIGDEPIPFLPNTFDIVLCLSMLEHVELRYTDKVVDECLMVSRGVVYFECPGEYPEHPDPIDNGMRVKSREGWEALLAGTGAKIEEYWDVKMEDGKSCTMVKVRPIP